MMALVHAGEKFIKPTNHGIYTNNHTATPWNRVPCRAKIRVLSKPTYMLKLENIIKGLFTTLLGIAAMCYAGYGWHVEWLTDWQATSIATVGFCLMFLRVKIEETLTKILGDLPAMLWKKLFGDKNENP